MSAPETEPRRLTPTERLHEVTMAAMTRAAAPPEHSVEITRNAKGVHQYEVTVRGYDLADVIQRALDVRAQLDEVLPYPENGS
jgi:hypothetical protein